MVLGICALGCTAQVSREGEQPTGAGAASGSGATTGSGGSAMGSGGSGASSGSSGSAGTSGQSSSGGSSSGSGGSSAGNPPVGPTSFACDAAAVPDSPAMRRLTHAQYENTLTDLLAFALGSRSDALAVTSAVASDLETLPNEERPKIAEDLRGTYRRLDQGLAQGHIDSWYAIGVRVGAELTTPARLETVVGSCATDGSPAAACVDAFIDRFAARAFRRPLDDADRALLRGFYGDTNSIDPLGFADLIGGILNAPDTLYLIESGANAVPGAAGVVELDPFETASRLSYHFWDTLPDDELWQTAEDQSLLDDAVYSREVDRLIADPRAKSSLRNFYREWLKLEDLPPLDQANGVPNYDAFTGDDQPSSMLTTNVTGEVLDLLDYFSWSEPSGLDTVLTTELLLPKTDDLAKLYGVSRSSNPVAAPNDDRPGLFTRVAFLATGSSKTRPIKKGVFLRENILCDEIPPPPAGASSNLPELPPTLSTREVVETLTASGTCAGCHAQAINPLGFPTESYDALGRFRTEEMLFDADGNLIGTAPVDTTSVPQIVEGDPTEVANAAELMSLVVASGKASACLARHYFRYSFGRWENVAKDGCALEALRSALVDSDSLTAMVRAVAFAPDFRHRTIVE